MCPGAALENFAFQHLNCATDTRSTIESLISIFEIVPLMADAVTGLLSLTRLSGTHQRGRSYSVGGLSLRVARNRLLRNLPVASEL
jgi:hypothetical protein